MSEPTASQPPADRPDGIDEAADDALLAELRLAVAQADPLPPRLLDTARAAYAWRTIDEELALLQFDSLAGTEVLVRSGGAHGVVLSFATGEVSIEVEAVPGGGLVGQVVPAGATSVALLLSSGDRVEAPCDHLGQFGFAHRPTGPVRLVAALPTGDVTTEWFTA